MNQKGSSWRIGAATLALAAASVLGGSASAKAAPQIAANTLIDGTTDTVTNIDPAGHYNYGADTVDREIFEHLLGFQPQSTVPSPELATGCTTNEPELEWTCTLRQGVKFQNGDPFTSADVAYSFDRVVKIHDPSGVWTLLANLQSVTTNGPESVTFHLPGRPEGFHLQPPTEPCVNLSIYTARPSHFLPPRDDSRRGRRVLLPISRLASTFHELGHPLRSTPITGASSLLPDDPPPPYTSVVSPFVFRTYRVFPCHCMESSQVPYPSPDQSHATYTPDTTWPISRHPPCRSWEMLTSPVSMSPNAFRCVISGSLPFVSLIHT